MKAFSELNPSHQQRISLLSFLVQSLTFFEKYSLFGQKVNQLFFISVQLETRYPEFEKIFPILDFHPKQVKLSQIDLEGRLQDSNIFKHTIFMIIDNFNCEIKMKVVIEVLRWILLSCFTTVMPHLTDAAEEPRCWIDEIILIKHNYPNEVSEASTALQFEYTRPDFHWSPGALRWNNRVTAVCRKDCQRIFLLKTRKAFPPKSDLKTCAKHSRVWRSCHGKHSHEK